MELVNLSSDSFSAPEPTNLTKESVSRIAENIASQLNYSAGKDLYDLVEGMGGTIAYKDFWSEGLGASGSLEVRSEDDFTIYVPFDSSELRDRFTIAHELGHYVLHYLWPIQVKSKEPFKLRASRYGSDRVEWEANWFSSAFLMPSEEFKKIARDGKTIGQIARHFMVSKSAAQLRAACLGIDV